MAHAAYYLESNGEAAIFDPLREVQPYLDRAAQNHTKIKYVFETHFHADFVSGHLDLSSRSGATIVFGPLAKPGYQALVAKDGQVFEVGRTKVKVIHTPGHTMESTTYLIIDEEGKEHGIITGDTLFIGDVGRPDLAQHVVEDLTQEKLAAHLYDSLRNKIMTMPDHLIVYPNHGAGSACGKKMSRETTDTLGHQKKVNYALRADMSREEFVEEILHGLVPPPGYFPQNVLMNINGYDSFDKVFEKAARALSPAEFELTANSTDALIIDTRSPEQFASGFIPGSINIGIDGSFAPWVGTLIPDLKQPLLIIADEARQGEVITRLARIGHDNIMGYLQGGFASWKNEGRETDQVEEINEDQLASLMEQQELNILDVRKAGEYASQHLSGAENLPLDFINQRMAEIHPGKTYYIHCASGYRSVIFISILKSRGYHHLINIKGGFSAIRESGQFALTDYVCPTTLL